MKNIMTYKIFESEQHRMLDYSNNLPFYGSSEITATPSENPLPKSDKIGKDPILDIRGKKKKRKILDFKNYKIQLGIDQDDYKMFGDEKKVGK